ncbi:hypothetical protein ABT187_40700 [Streptomyces sp. NPDC001817]|uniref:hypothetical protein n=1 Tax=Streptomyces sp. NPDC001817 TaxID=3154398 RepID=UPI003317C5A5
MASADLLAPLRDTHPQEQISVQTGDAAAAFALLDDGEADLAVAALSSHLTSLSYGPGRAWAETSPTGGFAASLRHRLHITPRPVWPR